MGYLAVQVGNSKPNQTLMGWDRKRLKMKKDDENACGGK